MCPAHLHGEGCSPCLAPVWMLCNRTPQSLRELGKPGSKLKWVWRKVEMGTKHHASVHLSLLLPGRVDSCHPLPAYIPCALWSPAHRAARLLPGAILKLPIWGDPADENCFEDDVYWEVRRGAARPRFAVAAGSGAEGAEGTRWRCRPAALRGLCRRCRRTRRATCTTCTTPTSPPRPEPPAAPRQGLCLLGMGPRAPLLGGEGSFAPCEDGAPSSALLYSFCNELLSIK